MMMAPPEEEENNEEETRVNPETSQRRLKKQ